MYCPRLYHFVRLQPSGKVGKCGHMVNAKEFDDIQAMDNSEWLKGVYDEMTNDRWPAECVRCEMTEKTNGNSIRLDMIERERILKAINKDYLIVGGVLDNVCNSACQSCNSTLSTKIGSLESKDYTRINNYDNFFKLPQHRITELDVNGGEPTASPNYKKLLNNLPSTVKIVRMNTNGSRMVPEVEQLLREGIRVIVTLSLDGVGQVHDYARWPILWQNYVKNAISYLELAERYRTLRLNCWTTVTCLNVGDLDNILSFTQQHGLDHSYGFCVTPTELDIRHKNKLTGDAKQLLSHSDNALCRSIADKCGSFGSENSEQLQTFVQKQDQMRSISFEDYFNFKPNLL